MNKVFNPIKNKNFNVPAVFLTIIFIGIIQISAQHKVRKVSLDSAAKKVRAKSRVPLKCYYLHILNFENL